MGEIQISVYDAGAELGDAAMDKTWIVSGQSEEQRQMIRGLPKDKAIYVEGGYRYRQKKSTWTFLIGVKRRSLIFAGFGFVTPR